MHSYTQMSSNVSQRPDVTDTALFLCDLQEKFRPVIHEYDACISTAQLMLRACTAVSPQATLQLRAMGRPPLTDCVWLQMGMPVAVTEQYPRGLGHTVSELTEHLTPAHSVVEKVCDFSVFGSLLAHLGLFGGTLHIRRPLDLGHTQC